MESEPVAGQSFVRSRRHSSCCEELIWNLERIGVKLKEEQMDPRDDPAHEDSWKVRTASVIEYSAQVMLSCVFLSYYSELDRLSISVGE